MILTILFHQIIPKYDICMNEMSVFITSYPPRLWMVWAYTLNFDGVGSDVFVVVVLGSMLFVSSDMSSLHHDIYRCWALRSIHIDFLFYRCWLILIYSDGFWLVMLMLRPLAVTPGVTHVGAYHRPSDGNLCIKNRILRLNKFKSSFSGSKLLSCLVGFKCCLVNITN